MDVTILRFKDSSPTARTITWPDSIKWNGGSAPTLDQSNLSGTDVNVITLLTRDEGVTWYGWESVNNDATTAEMWGYGWNNDGQLGQNNLTQYSSPVQVGSDTTWKNTITTSMSNTTRGAIKTDGTLWMWGMGEKGTLGLNQPHNTKLSSPTQIPGTTWNNIDSGNYCSYATKTDGTLWAWGVNAQGNLGQNDVVHYSSPVQIPGTNWSTVKGIGEVMATKTDGTLWTWGAGGPGSLMLNDRTDRSSPTQVPGIWNSGERGIRAGSPKFALKVE